VAEDQFSGICRCLAVGEEEEGCLLPISCCLCPIRGEPQIVLAGAEGDTAEQSLLVAYDWVKNNSAEIQRRYGKFLVGNSFPSILVIAVEFMAPGPKSTPLSSNSPCRLVYICPWLPQPERDPFTHSILVAFPNMLEMSAGCSASVMVVAALVAFCLVRDARA
jgi:hypothetical protein